MKTFIVKFANGTQIEVKCSEEAATVLYSNCNGQIESIDYK